MMQDYTTRLLASKIKTFLRVSWLAAWLIGGDETNRDAIQDPSGSKNLAQ